MRSLCRSTVGSMVVVLFFAGTTMAQPPGGGRGGDRGGGNRGGGDRGGGDRGGRGGGFDPSGFLSRLDRNGDGKLSPDEQEGPAGMMIQRLGSFDSKIKPGATISIKRISEAFQKMREGGGRPDGGDSNKDRSSRDDRGRSSGGSDDSLEMEPLVPGFGIDQPDYTVLGFGPSAEVFSVPVIDADRRQAQEVLDRYDRNKDGFIDKEEIKRGRFWGEPMDFDRNSDGKLSAMELSTRQAVRRGREDQSKNDRDKDRGRRRDDSPEPVTVDFEGRQSYRVYGETAPEGLPRFYGERDLNGDGQISMSEYTSDWTESRIAEFYGWDGNRDGTITLAEIQSGVNRGLVASDAPAGIPPASSIPGKSSAASSSQGSSNSSGMPNTSARSSTSPSPLTSPAVDVTGVKPDEKMVSYAKRIIGRNDTNQDGALTPSEWKSMLLSPAAADLNGDGRVTILEYATYRQAQQQRKR